MAACLRSRFLAMSRPSPSSSASTSHQRLLAKQPLGCFIQVADGSGYAEMRTHRTPDLLELSIGRGLAPRVMRLP